MQLAYNWTAMIVPAAFAMLLNPPPTETLPVDTMMEAIETAIPNLKDIQSTTEAEIGRLGPSEPNWEVSGMSAYEAITEHGGSVEGHVLGEWSAGGHGVAVPGDRPLAVPSKLKRYMVRDYAGKVDFHSYHGLPGGNVIHTFGSEEQIGDARCGGEYGIEVISPEPWQGWSPEVSVVTFGTAQATRDDSRTYCTLYRSTQDGRFSQFSYTPDGKPYVTINGDPQKFTVTTRADAAERMFGAHKER